MNDANLPRDLSPDYRPISHYDPEQPSDYMTEYDMKEIEAFARNPPYGAPGDSIKAAIREIKRLRAERTGMLIGQALEIVHGISDDALITMTLGERDECNMGRGLNSPIGRLLAECDRRGIRYRHVENADGSPGILFD